MFHSRRLKCESLEGRCLLAAHLLTDAPINSVASYAGLGWDAFTRSGSDIAALASADTEFADGGLVRSMESERSQFQGPQFQGPLAAIIRAERSPTESALSSAQDPFHADLLPTPSRQSPLLDWDGDEIVVVTSRFVPANADLSSHNLSLLLVKQPVPPLSMTTTELSLGLSTGILGTGNLGTLARGNSLIVTERIIDSPAFAKSSVSVDCCRLTGLAAKPTTVSSSRAETPASVSGASYVSQSLPTSHESSLASSSSNNSVPRHASYPPLITVQEGGTLDAYGQSLRSGSSVARATSSQAERDASANSHSSNPRFGGFVELSRADFRTTPLAPKATSTTQDPLRKLDVDESDSWLDDNDAPTHGDNSHADGELTSAADARAKRDSIAPAENDEYAFEPSAHPADLAIEQLFAAPDQPSDGAPTEDGGAGAHATGIHSKSYGGMIWLANDAPNQTQLGHPASTVRDANIAVLSGGFVREFSASNQPIAGHTQAFELNRGESPTDSMLAPPVTQRTAADVAAEKGDAGLPTEQESPRAATLGIPAVGLAVMLWQQKRSATPQRDKLSRPLPWFRRIRRVTFR